MVSEVETILNEIRERVRADQEQRPASGTLVVQGEPGAESLADPVAESGSGSAESLARLSAHLTTTERAWDRLPPLYSNRSGMTARFELWIKARFKSLSRWFTWEQVNFNAAVHHALSNTLAALRTHEQELLRIRADLKQETEARLARFEQAEREVQALRARVETQMGDIRSRVSSLANQNVAIEARLAETNNRLDTEDGARISEMAKEIDGRLSALAADLREEQRVCFKQLSLETSEAAAFEDRGRRAIESRLEKLEQSGPPRDN